MSNKVVVNRMEKAMARVSKGLDTLMAALKELQVVPGKRGRKAKKGRKVAKVAKVKKSKGKRGRKPGSKNKVKGTTVTAVPSTGKRLGRPKGSKNRVVSAPVEPSVADLSTQVAPNDIFVENPGDTEAYRAGRPVVA
jgi:hypothetical protein